MSPITILGDDLLAWWTADDANTVTLVGSAVSAWRDKKNGYELTQSLGAARPAYSATSFNGKPGLSFDGVDDRLSEESVFSFPIGSAGGEIWGVIQQNAAAADAGTKVMLSYGGSSSAVRRGAGRIAASGVNRGQVDVGNGSVVSGANNLLVDLSGRHVLRGKIEPTVCSVDVDTTPAASSTSVIPATGTVRTRIGAISNTSASNFWNGLMRDVIVTQPLSAGKASDLLSYLLARRAL